MTTLKPSEYISPDLLFPGYENIKRLLHKLHDVFSWLDNLECLLVTPQSSAGAVAKWTMNVRREGRVVHCVGRRVVVLVNDN